MRKLTLMLTILLVAAVVFSSQSALAQIEIKSQVNFDSGMQGDTWNFIEVTIQNKDDADWYGTVELVYGAVYTQELFLAGGRESTVHFYLPPVEIYENFLRIPSDRYAPYSGSMEIRLKDEKGNTVKITRPNPPEKSSTTIGVFTSRPEQFARLANLVDGSMIVPVQSAYLDEQVYLDKFSLIVISDLESLLVKPEQAEKLAAWVDRGGLLIIGGGRGWQKNISAVPERLLPYVPDGTVEISDLRLAHDGQIFSGGEALITSGTVRGEVILEAAGHPLLIAGSYGRGRVIYAVLNLEDPPFDNIADYENFWRHLIYGSYDLLSGGLFMIQQSWGIREILSYIVGPTISVNMLSPGKVLLGLLLYVLLIGPINYLALRRFGRLEWSWLTIPALAVAFTASIYLFSSLGRTSELTHYQLNLIELNREDTASLHSYNTIFIPRRGDVSFDLPFDKPGAGRGATVTCLGGTSGSTITMINPPLWSMQQVYGRDEIQLDGAFRMQLEIEQNQVAMVVTNDSGFSISESYTRLGNSWYTTGALPAGEKTSIPLRQGRHTGMINLSQLLKNYGSGAPYHRPQIDLDHLFPSQSDLLFIGFSEEPELIHLDNTARSTPLNILMATGDASQFKLGPTFDLAEGWLIPKLVVEGTNIYGQDIYMHRGGYEFSLTGTGHIDLIFTFPPGIDYSEGIYTFNFSDLYGDGTAELAFYNGSSGEWETWGDLRPHSGQTIQLSGIETLVLQDRLLLKISYDEQQRGYMWFNPRRIFSLKGGKLK